MARVSTVQFNGSNAYELLQGDFITSFPFETVNFGNIALSVQIYSFATTGKVRVKVKGFDTTGKMIANVYQDFTPTQNNIWQMLEATWEVPEEMVKGEVQLESISGTNLIAQPKAISGTLAGAYSTNYSQQLTFITQTGLYTGTVTAHQVILVDKDNLSNRLVTINNSLLSLQDREDKISTEITAQGVTITSNKQSISANTSRIDSLNASLGTQILKLGEIDKKTGELGLSVETIGGEVSNQSRSISSLTAGNLTLSTSTKGKIGSFTINSNYLISSSTSYEVRLSANSAYDAFQVHDRINNRLNFSVAHDGFLYARSANIAGNITAESGKIGSFTLSNGRLTSGTGTSSITISSSDTGGFIWAGGDWSTAKFKVQRDGTLYASNAVIKGTLQAGSIVNGQLNSTTGTHTGYTTGRHSGSLYNVGGTYTGGLVNTTGTHTGYTTGRHSGSLYSTSGTHSGALYRTTGSHNGSIYSTTGRLGGVEFSSSSSGSGLRFNNAALYFGRVGSTYQSVCRGDFAVSGTLLSRDGSVVTLSDVRVKENISPIDLSVSQELLSIKVHEYNYIESPEKKHFGVIAQEVLSDTNRAISDKVVGTNGGYFVVNYQEFVPLLIKLAQDQEKRIKELEEKIA